jgi:hypothetical protein
MARCFRSALWLLACVSACAPRSVRTPTATQTSEPQPGPLLTAQAESNGKLLPPSAAVATQRQGLRALHYTFGLDAKLSTLSARLCFEGGAPAQLVCGAAKSTDLLHDPVLELANGQTRTLQREQHLIKLDDVAANSCIDYRIDVSAALENDSLMLAYPGEQSLLVGVELFLWRPAKRPPNLTTTVRFVLPEGMQVSTPWPEQAGEYALDESAFAFTGHLVFGQFAREQVAVPGSKLDVVVMNGFAEPTRSLIDPWLATSAAAVSQPMGTFPAVHVQVIVVPTSPSTFPIHFGHTGRSGGGSIVLFMPTDMDAKAFREDWIAVHEFSHLLHPFVQRGDAWLSEGLATYLQEVLRVRAGLLPEQQAWRRLYEGAQLGRATDQSLAQETHRMAFAGNYQRVYWAGAAIALMADVELRRKTAGKVSLDTVLTKLVHDRVGTWQGLTAAELLRAMDERAGVAVFQDIAGRYLSGGRLPDLSALYEQLGLLDGSGALVDRKIAPLSWVRDAIMAGAVAARLPD